MTIDQRSRQRSTPDFTLALNQLWTRFLPEIGARVTILEAAAQACAAGDITTELREAAHAAAHKLAGTLGTFSLTHGTELAREFELACTTKESCASTDIQRLVEIAVEIRTIVDGRN